MLCRTLLIRCGKPGGGKGALVSDNLSQCLGTGNGQTLIMENNCNITDDVVARMKYIVRRLTPTECERLSGLPDGYTVPAGLDVTDELVEEFQNIWNEWDRITAPGKKPKTAKQVRAWLEKIANAETCPDAPRYKACGNGWATNQPRWILFRMLDSVDQDWMDCMVDGNTADSVLGRMFSTNSNGVDVAPCLSANMAKLGGDNQTIMGGGTSSHVKSHNFELFDNADEACVCLNAKRAHDTLAYWRNQ